MTSGDARDSDDIPRRRGLCLEEPRRLQNTASALTALFC
jgi:hypothetical protein